MLIKKCRNCDAKFKTPSHSDKEFCSISCKQSYHPAAEEEMMPMFDDLVLFVTVAKKYENIVSRSINQYLNLCQDKINRVFLICEDTVDQSKISLNLPSRIINDSQAIEILGLSDPEYSCITHDKWLLQQVFKLNCDSLTDAKKCIITDPDSLLLKPIRFHVNGRINLFYHNGYENPVNSRRIRLLTEFFFGKEVEQYNFVTENILFEAEHLIEVRKLIGDMRQYRTCRNRLLDLTIDEYKRFAGVSWPVNPLLTEYKPFYPDSVNTVIFKKLPIPVQRELKAMYEEKMIGIIDGLSSVVFSEYQIYSYYMMLNHPDKVRMRPLNLRIGCLPKSDPVFWYNTETPGGREDVFNMMYDHYISKINIE